MSANVTVAQALATMRRLLLSDEPSRARHAQATWDTVLAGSCGPKGMLKESFRRLSRP